MYGADKETLLTQSKQSDVHFEFKIADDLKDIDSKFFEGHSFSGVWVDKDGNEFNNDEILHIDGVLELYPKLEPKKYTITFIAEGMVSQEYEYGATPVYNGPTPTKDQDAKYTYDFAGWSTNPDENYENALTSLPEVKKAETYYAIYKPTVRQYTVTWVVEGQEDVVETYNYGDTPIFKNEIIKSPEGLYYYEQILKNEEINIMKRFLMDDLVKWKDKPNRKPLILKGARQVGKTWIMKEFGARYFKDTIYINFDNNEVMKKVFEIDFDISRIISAIKIEHGKRFDVEDTLIIFAYSVSPFSYFFSIS